jgi:hypothetical protein
VNCPWGELSVGQAVHGAKYPWGELSVGRNVRGARCLGASFHGASFRGASCRGASFDGASGLGTGYYSSRRNRQTAQDRDQTGTVAPIKGGKGRLDLR